MKRKLLFLLMLVMGVSGAWATDLTTMVGQVGPTDNSGVFAANHSKSITLAAGETYVYTFVNYNKGAAGTDEWENWVFECKNESNQYLTMRADNAGWGDAGTIAYSGNGYSDVSTTKTDWLQAYNGVTVTLTVTRSTDGQTITVSHTATTNNSTTYAGTWTCTNVGTGTITAYLMNEDSHQIITNVLYTDASGNKTNYAAATLNHTAAVQGSNNTAGTSLDAKTHYYNGWGTSGWVAQAYIGFSGVVPADMSYAAATLSFYSTVGGSSNRTLDVYSLANPASFDWNNLTLSKASGTAVATGVTDPLNGSVKTIDATSAVSSLLSEKAFDAVFQLGGGAAGGTLQGKATTTSFPPILEIKSTSATQTTYTVNYYDATGTSIKTARTSASVNVGDAAAVTDDDKAAIYSGGKKYIFDSDNTNNVLSIASLDATAGNNVMNVYFREAATYTYTVKSSIGTTIVSETSNFEGETISYGYPRYINNGGTLYSATKQSGNPWWGSSFTLDENNKVVTISYTATEINNVVYFTETEDITGATKVTKDNTDIRCSNKAAGNYEGTLINLPAGIYKLGTSVWGNAGATITFKAGENTILEAATIGSIKDYTSAPFTLTEATDITVSGMNGSKNADFVYITSIPSPVTRSTANGKYGTICLPYVFTATGATLYSATLNTAKDAVTLESVTTPVAGTPYIYQATAATQTFTYSTGDIVTTPVAAAPLTGVFTSTKLSSGDYILQTQEEVQAFYKVSSDDIYCGAYKAYIKSTAVSGVKAITIGDGEETAIKALNALTSGEAKIYDLSGRQLQKLQKGVNIVNGVKVLVK